MASGDIISRFLPESEILKRQDTLLGALLDADVIDTKTFFKARATGEVYSTKFPTYETNTTSDGEKLNASAGLVAVPSTETEAGRDDFASRNAFRYIDCNFICTDDGVKVPTVLAGQEGYTNTGKVDVGILTPPTYWAIEKHYDDGYYIVHFSDTKHEELDMVPTPWCVDPAGNEMGYGIVTKYYAGYIDGILYSSSGVINPGFMSYQYGHTELQKKGTGYYGSGSERTAYLLCMLWIKYATKNSQKKFNGCTSYNLRYYAAEETTDENYIIIAADKAKNLVVGSCVTVGEIGSNTNLDRGQSYTYDIKNRVRITAIEAVEGTSNSRVYLEGDAFSCTTTTLLSTITCASGETDNVLGADGYVANDSKHAFKLGGVEEGIGAYYVSLNEVWNRETTTTVSYYVRGNAAWSTSISGYTKVGTFDMGDTTDAWIGDIDIDLSTGVIYPRVYGSGDSVGCGDRQYKGGSGTGTREALLRGYLWGGSDAGLVRSALGDWLSSRDWRCALAV
jgi:hypothetical protein